MSSIAEIKVGFELLEKIYRWFKPKSKQDALPPPNEVFTLVDRFIEIFKAHGIERTQISRFLEDKHNLNLADLAHDERLLDRLDEDLLNYTCNKFGINRAWLDGEDEPIYETLNFYKHLDDFIDFMASLKEEGGRVECFVIKRPEDKLIKNGPDYSIALVFRREVGEISDRPVYRYYLTWDTWFWSYPKTRLQLKSIILISWQFKVHISGVELEKDSIDKLLDGKLFPHTLLDRIYRNAWHPDDYIFTSEESCAVQDEDEALMVRELMAERGWMQKLERVAGSIEGSVPLKTLSGVGPS